MRVVLGRVDGLGITDIDVGRSVRRLGAVPGGVFLAQQQRVDAELAGELVEAAFDAERRDRRARCPISGDLRPVRHDIVADDVDVGDVVHRKAAHASRTHRRARKGPGLIFEREIGGDDPPVPLGADLDLDNPARGRPGPAEHFLAAHHHLDRPARLLGHRQGQRLEIDERLAAEPAADLGRDRADLRNIDAEQFGAIGAHHELALARAPDRALAVGRHRDDAGMRLDISLVHRLRRVAALDDDIGLAEPGFGVALGEGHPLGDVRRMGRLGIDALGEQIVVQQRSVGLHRLFDVDDVRQHMVVDLDQLAGFLGDRRRGGGDGGHCVPVIERPLARHAIGRQVSEIHRPFADERLFRGDRREILPSDHRLDPGQCPGLLGVDRQDAGVRMRAALDLAPQHARHHHVGAEIGAPGDLVDPVGADRTGADDLLKFLRDERHEDLAPVLTVTPAEAGAQGQPANRCRFWIPACAGMTG